MPYCSQCGQFVSEDARFCSNCGRPIAALSGATPPVSQGKPSLDDVPGWLGWLALPIVILTTLVGLGLYSYWAYRRGRRDGVGREPTSPPTERFAWQVVGWGLAGIVPILGWYAVVHLPTICYKQGLRVGAREGTASMGFTSLPALATAFGGAVVVAVAALFLAGLALAVAEGDSATEPIRIVPQRQAPTPSGPRLTGAEAAGKAEAFLRQRYKSLTEQGIFVYCDPEDYNGRTHTWIVLCTFEGPSRSVDFRMLVDDRTGQVRFLE